MTNTGPNSPLWPIRNDEQGRLRQEHEKYDFACFLDRETAELEKAQAEATGWGAAVGARHERLKALYAKRAADRSTK